jgi:nicotinamide mononucleotide (NMN) deamidase PncC/2'-5' RNA ligase
MRPAAVATDAFRAAVAGAVELRQEMLRLYGIPESEIAETLRLAQDAHGLEGLEITTCLRRGEVEVVTRFAPAAAASYERFVETVRERHADTLFSDDGRTVDQQVADLLRTRRLTIATAESCTGGLLAGRLTDLAGSSDYVLGGLVVYSNEAKVALAGSIRRSSSGWARCRSRSPRRWPTARARWTRHRRGHHGRGRSGGGTPEKPVRLVWFSVAGVGGDGVSRLTRSINLPGDRADIRDRSTTVAMHGAPAARRRAVSARLFAALELPVDVRAGLAAFGREAAARDRALRPTRRDALHLTLRFSATARGEIDPAREAVRGVAGSPAPVLSSPTRWLAPRRRTSSPSAWATPRRARRAAGHRGRAAGQRPAVGAREAAVPAHITVARVRREWRPRIDDLPEAPQATFIAGAWCSSARTGRRRTVSLRAARAGGAGVVARICARSAAASSQSRVEP